MATSKSNNISRGVILNVPFEEKDEAKKLGAWWDPGLRRWFVPQGMDAESFRRWFVVEDQNRKEAEG